MPARDLLALCGSLTHSMLVAKPSSAKGIPCGAWSRFMAGDAKSDSELLSAIADSTDDLRSSPAPSNCGASSSSSLSSAAPFSSLPLFTPSSAFACASFRLLDHSRARSSMTVRQCARATCASSAPHRLLLASLRGITFRLNSRGQRKKRSKTVELRRREQYL